MVRFRFAPWDDAIELLLPKIPKLWGPLHQTEFTDVERDVVERLSHSMLIERRTRVVLQPRVGSGVLEAVCVHSGVDGVRQAIEPALQVVRHLWASTYQDWKVAGESDPPPFACDMLAHEEWRLTPHGLLAIAESKFGIPDEIKDYVLKRGDWKGKEHPKGTGRLVGIRHWDDVWKTETPLAPTSLASARNNVPRHLADAVLAVLQETRTHDVPKITHDSAPQRPWRKEGRLADTEARLMRDLSEQREEYDRLVIAVGAGDSSSRREFQKRFGPAAMARRLAEQDGRTGDLVEFNRLRTAIQATRLYAKFVKPVLNGEIPAEWRPARLPGTVDDSTVDALITQWEEEVEVRT